MTDPEDIDLTALSRRNFLMMLAPGNPDIVNALSDVQSASPDVQAQESMDIMVLWLELATRGSLKYVNEAATWVSEIASESLDELPFRDLITEKVRSGYYSFGVALIHHLISCGAAHVHTIGDPQSNLLEFIASKPESFSIATVDLSDAVILGDDDEEDDFDE